jgi:hypothetical protein
MKMRLMEVAVFRADGRTDVTGLVVAIRFPNAPKVGIKERAHNLSA